MKWDGQKISVPGMYDDLPLVKYHSDICAGPSISSSGLRMLDPTLGKTPAHYWHSSYLNPEFVPPPPESHFTLGQAVHTLFLGQEGFARSFSVRPEVWEGAPWQSNRTSCRKWMADQSIAGKQVLTANDFDIIKGMAVSASRDYLISNGLLNGEIEKSLIWQDRKTGIWLKSRPDAIPANSDMLVDVKTIQESDRRSCEQAVYEYGYHMQFALAEMGMQEVLGRDVSDHVLVFIAKKPPHLINVKPVHRHFIDDGRRQIRRAIDIFAGCLKDGKWPGWRDYNEYINEPEWLKHRLDDEAAAKELPTLKETVYERG